MSSYNVVLFFRKPPTAPTEEVQKVKNTHALSSHATTRQPIYFQFDFYRGCDGRLTLTVVRCGDALLAVVMLKTNHLWGVGGAY